MINLNNLGLIKQFISQYWIETSFTMKENSFTLPIDIFPHPISHKVFIKKRIGSSPMYLKQPKQTSKLSIQKEVDIHFINNNQTQLSVQIAYSINSNQWDDDQKTITYSKNKSNYVIESINQNTIKEIPSIVHTIKKEKEIQRLHNKLHHYQYQNDKIKDENKKLLEVIQLYTNNKKDNSSITNISSLKLSSINPFDITGLDSTSNNIKELRNNLKLSPNNTITYTEKNISSKKSLSKVNKRDINDHCNNRNESSVEDLEERLNDEFLYNKYDIPLQINVGMVFEKYDIEEDNKDINNKKNEDTDINNNQRIPFELMNKDKLYKNIVESNNINYYINEI